ncbi:MAG: hypothetical protein QNJ61_18690 [Desulfobacterales bacterium]|nr:hypothetical protein [Desulfobacterales bacterium]
MAVNHPLDSFRTEFTPVEYEGHILNGGGILSIEVPRASLVGKKPTDADCAQKGEASPNDEKPFWKAKYRLHGLFYEFPVFLTWPTVWSHGDAHSSLINSPLVIFPNHPIESFLFGIGRDGQARQTNNILDPVRRYVAGINDLKLGIAIFSGDLHGLT